MRRSFPTSTSEKTTVSAGKNGPFAYARKQMLCALKFFPASTAKKPLWTPEKMVRCLQGIFPFPKLEKSGGRL